MPRGHNPKPKGIDSSNFVHGAAARDSFGRRHPIYIAWVNMRQRCKNKNKWDYKFYGGRGIGYCERWEKFEKFYSDLGATYQLGMTLDRIDVNGDYCPENCRWSTRREQSNNRNYNRLITFNGKSQTAGKWADEVLIKIDRKEIYKRVFTRKWDVGRALTQPYGTRLIIKRWSIKYSGCRKCFTTKKRHGGHGLCANCLPVERRKQSSQFIPLRSS